MTETITSNQEDLQTVLRKQRQRVVTALTTADTIDASPIIRDSEDLSSEEFVTLVYELHHIHLPALQANGVIEFDRREEMIKPGIHFDKARQLYKSRDHR